MHAAAGQRRRRRRRRCCSLESLLLCTYLCFASLSLPPGTRLVSRNPGSRVTASLQPREESRDTFVCRCRLFPRPIGQSRLSGGFGVEASVRELVRDVYISCSASCPLYYSLLLGRLIFLRCHCRERLSSAFIFVSYKTFSTSCVLRFTSCARSKSGFRIIFVSCATFKVQRKGSHKREDSKILKCNSVLFNVLRCCSICMTKNLPSNIFPVTFFIWYDLPILPPLNSYQVSLILTSISRLCQNHI